MYIIFNTNTFIYHLEKYEIKFKKKNAQLKNNWNVD